MGPHEEKLLALKQRGAGFPEVCVSQSCILFSDLCIIWIYFWGVEQKIPKGETIFFPEKVMILEGI